MDDVQLTILYGEKKLEPVKYWIEERYIRKWFGFALKTEYYLYSDFMHMGPFETSIEIKQMCNTYALELDCAK